MRTAVFRFIFMVIVMVLLTGCGGSSAETVLLADSKDVKSGESEKISDTQAEVKTSETPVETPVDTPVIQVTCTCQCPQCVGGTGNQSGSVTTQQAGAVAEDGKVNINTADEATLQTLNGIGQSRAQAIISYRETHGVFQSIEDIKNIDGIKDGIFNKIKDDISVG